MLKAATPLPKTKSNEYPRFWAVGSHLPRLPRELIHQIIDTLSVQKILEIICTQDSPYLDECVATHMTIGRGILPPSASATCPNRSIACQCQKAKVSGPLNDVDLPNIKAWFTLYMRLRRLDRVNPHPRISFLDDIGSVYVHQAALQHLQKQTKASPPKTKISGSWGEEEGERKEESQIVVAIKDGVLFEMKRYDPYIPSLSHFVQSLPNSSLPIPTSEFWDTSSVAALSSVFDLIDSAQVSLTLYKSRQLTRMADLLERYPRFLRTCTEINVQQDIRRNPLHLVENLRLAAGKMVWGTGFKPGMVLSGDESAGVRREIVEGNFVARSIFAQRQFYLVPYDRVLRAFLKTLDKYPPGSEVGARYPQDIQVILDGFAHMPAREKHNPPNSPVPRVLNTKYSAPDHQKKGKSPQPTFFVYPDHIRAKPRKMNKHNGILPFPEEEFVWLEAFLEVCQYMSQMKEDWGGGKTVEEYWRVHVL